MAEAGAPLGGWHAILVHGAWQGAWVWEAFAPLLRARGATVEAIDLPGARGERPDARFEEWVDALVERIDASAPGRAVVLVAHSGGAVVAAQAAERRAPRLAALVAIAGILPPSGSSLGAVIASMVAEGHDARSLQGIRPHLLWSADGSVSRVPARAAREIFLHDCDPRLAHAAAARLVAQSEAARSGVPRLSEAGFGRVPRIYVEALQDRSIVPALQRRMQALVPGATALTIDAGHAPQLSRPGALDALLAEPMSACVERWAAARHRATLSASSYRARAP